MSFKEFHARLIHYARRPADKLAPKRNYIDGWRDGDKSYFDISTVVSSRRKALQLARRHKQEEGDDLHMTKPHLVLVRGEDLKDPKVVDAVLASLGVTPDGEEKAKLRRGDIRARPDKRKG